MKDLLSKEHYCYKMYAFLITLSSHCIHNSLKIPTPTLFYKKILGPWSKSDDDYPRLQVGVSCDKDNSKV